MKDRERAKQLADDGMRCNCDFDNWAPEPDTGHTWKCRIHRAVHGLAEWRPSLEAERKDAALRAAGVIHQ